ncbi:hypothetical protein [Ideonella sp.]|jgi:hypothetical protein|uniref:hypothetical protein n=1 Tax=Ideonella sp. TaxID=1929293 RepID=UPI0037BED096
MSKNNSDEQKPGVAKATLTPADLAQAVAEAHPEWLGQPLDARLLGQALREAFGVLRKQVDEVDVGTVAVPSLGRFHARRAPNKPDLRRVLFLTPQAALPGASEAVEQGAEDAAEDAPALAAEPVAAPEGAPAKSSSKGHKRKR